MTQILAVLRGYVGTDLVTVTGHRRLLEAQGAPARSRRSAGDRGVLPGGAHRRSAEPEDVRGAPRLHHVGRLRHGSGDRKRLGLRGAGPPRLITDLGVLEPDRNTKELTLVAVHPGVEVETAKTKTG
jgi:hypothetical protein